MYKLRTSDENSRGFLGVLSILFSKILQSKPRPLIGHFADRKLPCSVIRNGDVNCDFCSVNSNLIKLGMRN